MVLGTSRGYISLWDLRFQIILRLWKHSSGMPIHKVQPVPLGYAESMDGPTSSLPYCFVATGKNETAVWNLETGELSQVLRNTHT